MDLPPTSSNDDLRRLVANAFATLDQPPPPTLREILTAYRSKGDGDRDMLLAMLNAKTAEDQRIASIASLQRTLLDVYQIPRQESSRHSQQPQPHHNPTHHYPASHCCDRKPRRQHHHHQHHHHMPLPSPHNHHHTSILPACDVPIYQDYPSRKRHRSSLSPLPHEAHSDTRLGSQHEHLPPSPYSSSGRSDSAEYSPRSRTSMAIGSLLSSGPPPPDANTDDL